MDVTNRAPKIVKAVAPINKEQDPEAEIEQFLSKAMKYKIQPQPTTKV